MKISAPTPKPPQAHSPAALEREALWHFITALYSQDGVKGDCLTLQDTYGCDVVLLLFLIWLDRTAASTRLSLDAASQVAERAQAPIRQHRTERRAAKSGDPERYAALLKAELEMEKAELFSLLSAHRTARKSVGHEDGSEAAEAAEAALGTAYFARAYAAKLGFTLPKWAETEWPDTE